MIEPFGNELDGNDADGNRDDNRDSLFLKAILRFPSGGEEREARIRNLSAGGLMAEAPTRVTRGEKVEVNLRNLGWVSGSVAWITEGRLGIAFDHPIDPKATRNNVGGGQHDENMPRYLKKLNRLEAPDGKTRWI